MVRQHQRFDLCRSEAGDEVRGKYARLFTDILANAFLLQPF
jgi:hypothetical protein